MKLALVLVCVIGAVACKSKSGDDKDKGAGSATGSASASGSSSASGSGSASASAADPGSASGTANRSGSAIDPGPGPAGANVDPDQAFAALEVAARKMCECKDVACLEATELGLKDLGAQLPDEPSPELAAKLQALETEVQICALKIAEAVPLPAEHAAEGTKLLEEFRALRDQICKCTSAGCAEAIAQGGEALDAKVQEIYALDEDGHLPAPFEAVMKSAAICFGKLAEPPQ